MIPIIQQNLSQVADLCDRFGVQTLEVFGSAASANSDVPVNSKSDIDFLVEFNRSDSGSLFHRYFGLMEALERVFDRKIDLVSAGALTNPYLIASVNQSRLPIYASARAQTT